MRYIPVGYFVAAFIYMLIGQTQTGWIVICAGFLCGIYLKISE